MEDEELRDLLRRAKAGDADALAELDKKASELMGPRRPAFDAAWAERNADAYEDYRQRLFGVNRNLADSAKEIQDLEHRLEEARRWHAENLARELAAGGSPLLAPRYPGKPDEPGPVTDDVLLTVRLQDGRERDRHWVVATGAARGLETKDFIAPGRWQTQTLQLVGDAFAKNVDEDIVAVIETDGVIAPFEECVSIQRGCLSDMLAQVRGSEPSEDGSPWLAILAPPDLGFGRRGYDLGCHVDDAGAGVALYVSVIRGR